jgi:hypothetical protein
VDRAGGGRLWLDAMIGTADRWPDVGASVGPILELAISRIHASAAPWGSGLSLESRRSPGSEWCTDSGCS